MISGPTYAGFPQASLLTGASMRAIAGKHTQSAGPMGLFASFIPSFLHSMMHASVT